MSVEEPTVTGNSTNGVLISVSPRFRLKLLPSSALNAVQFQEQFYLTWYSFLNFPCQLFSISVHLSIFPSSSILFRVTGRVESVSFHHTRGGGYTLEKRRSVQSPWNSVWLFPGQWNVLEALSRGQKKNKKILFALKLFLLEEV